MDEILYSEECEGDYENFYAKCPYCNKENIFNRVSDLEILEPVCFHEVKCSNQECNKPFYINGDSVSSNKSLDLLIDCQKLIKQKKYSDCITKVTQAYEVYFEIFIRVKLILLVYKKETDLREDLQKSIDTLYEKTKRFAYKEMRNICFHILIEGIQPNSLSDSLKIIGDISHYKKDPKDKNFNKIKNEDLKKILIEIKKCNVNELRNDVIHKMAYRASREKAEQALKEAHRHISNMSNITGVSFDNINLYINGHLPMSSR